MTPTTGLTALVLATAQTSVPVAWDSEQLGKHPGQNGQLTHEQVEIATAAWRYFENNFQPTTCLYNSVDGYPNTTMWDTASALAALVGAYELNLIFSQDFDHRMGCLLESLNQLPLYRGEAPNKAYHTITLASVNYDNQAGEIGFSAIDLGRLLLWLDIVKSRYPLHADAIDRLVLRWSFCNLVDRTGALHGATNSGAGEAMYLQEGRLGYEEYAATGFQLWGFDTTAASDPEPYEEIGILGVPIAYDARDPKFFGAHNYVVTEAVLLSGLEMNWDRAGDTNPSDLYSSDRTGYTLAKRIFKAQVHRWRRTGTLTARTEHHLDGPPYFIYDTIYSDGTKWPTIADDARLFPELAAVSTKAAIGMSVLLDTPYTDRLAEAAVPMLSPKRGLHEGFYENGGARIEALTANTNGIVLEALLYKTQGKLHRGPTYTLWDTVPNSEHPGNSQCLPRTATQ